MDACGHKLIEIHQLGFHVASPYPFSLLPLFDSRTASTLSWGNNFVIKGFINLSLDKLSADQATWDVEEHRNRHGSVYRQGVCIRFLAQQLMHMSLIHITEQLAKCVTHALPLTVKVLK
ncbi:hypothetical protein HPP92_023597 [Vanilla planifolia]|uniref:Uncharacterized protein n=1 Tax=Vanilla planifolia TaxID=51239 RepID=A0A835UES6_VANPL|nr:hypothetical protein HPP92_023597 [Vanilla planifolia]